MSMAGIDPAQPITWPINLGNGAMGQPLLPLPLGSNFVSSVAKQPSAQPDAAFSMFSPSTDAVALGGGSSTTDVDWKHSTPEKVVHPVPVEEGQVSQNALAVGSGQTVNPTVDGCPCGKPLVGPRIRCLPGVLLTEIQRHQECAKVRKDENCRYFCDVCVGVFRDQHSVTHLQNPLPPLFITGEDDGTQGMRVDGVVASNPPPHQQSAFLPGQRVPGSSPSRVSNVNEASARRAATLRQGSPYARRTSPLEAEQSTQTSGSTSSNNSVVEDSNEQPRPHGLAVTGSDREMMISKPSDASHPITLQVVMRKVLVCASCNHRAVELADVVDHVGKKHEKQATFYEAMEVQKCLPRYDM
ncbi:unnamed protein product [Peniophora sp. CBMAI 1063]|nr:unnamed protein product [Peniophora sp. CBMAI 1063]